MPPSKADPVLERASSPDKRKHEEDAPQPKHKKRKTSESILKAADIPTEAALPIDGSKVEDVSVQSERAVLRKYRVTESAKSQGAPVNVRKRIPSGTKQQIVEQAPASSDAGRVKKEKKHKRRQSEETNNRNIEEEEDVDAAAANTGLSTDSQQSARKVSRDEDTSQHKEKPKKRKEKLKRAHDDPGESMDDAAKGQKHARVLSKFEKARQQDHQPRLNEVTEKPPPELHGLEPIPQPQKVDVVREAPSYSVLPPWQENPLIVSSESTTEFNSFELSTNLETNLRRLGLDRPLPVQATVLPLLLSGPSKHPGDLCISAATGSGKTLSYVLPIVADLKDLPGTKLRAVIVVPTRELVKQVRDLSEACTAGTSLQIVTAVGSKSLVEEQAMLVKEEKVYDPEAYKKWQQSPIDWSNFSLAKLAKRAKDEDPLESVDYITQYKSKVDILITTPGRLVDHLRSTPGFTLDHVTWLVVDEADRLLNESYQEWVTVVKPTLESQAATQKRDDLLRYMRMTPPRRTVTKVLLSATMTRDLSKLNALGLHNPKLVVLAGQTEDNAKVSLDAATGTSRGTSANESFHLPDTLKETAVPVSDGSEKPLYLLELVRVQIGISDALLKPASGGSEGSAAIELEADANTDTSSDFDDTSSSDSDTDSSSNSSSGSKITPRQTKVAKDKRKETLQLGNAPRVLIFARSTASAERLSRLFCLLDPGLAPRIATLTRSTASSASSRQALASFRSFKISILIATDRASRGLDVPGLDHVVSYDVPNSALTYVHRVGRTARAGREGQAWTLLEHREAAWFWREIGGKSKQPISRILASGVSITRSTKVSKVFLSLEHADLKQRYEEALKQLGDEALGKSS